jgi:hypothetical protein
MSFSRTNCSGEPSLIPDENNFWLDFSYIAAELWIISLIPLETKGTIPKNKIVLLVKIKLPLS